MQDDVNKSVVNDEETPSGPEPDFDATHGYY